jgi:hypothetical protein
MRKFCSTSRKHSKPLVIFNWLETRLNKSLLIFRAYMEFHTF